LAGGRADGTDEDALQRGGGEKNKLVIANARCGVAASSFSFSRLTQC